MKCIYCLKISSNQNHKCRSQIIQPELDNNKDKIVDLMNNGYATSYIANNSIELLGFATTNGRLMFFCKRHQIIRKTLKEAANSIITRNLYKSTVEKIYGSGIINVSQCNVVKEKKIQTNLDRYGVINPFQRDDVKIASKQTLLRKYGVENPIDIPGRKSNNGRFSKPHKKVSDYLTSVGIIHLNDPTGKFRKFNEKLSKTYSPIPDIYIPDKNIIIEIYGDRWHMNPAIYKSTDIVRFFVGERTATECWYYDNIRINHLTSFGIEVIVIWELEIKSNFELVKQRIREKYATTENFKN